MSRRERPEIVLVDDSPGDRLLAVTAMREAGIDHPVREFGDSEQLLEFLRHRGHAKDEPAHSGRLVILLDLNMPRKGGLETLAELKADPALRRIPVVMLTTSESESDLVRSYDLGVNSFVTKPLGFPEFCEAMRQLGGYWLDLARIPRHKPRA